MKALNIAVTSLLLIAGESFAASTVSDVVARQRWPWNGKVDIDYTLTGDKTDVDFHATWDGQATPVLIGTDYSAEAGQHRYELDPSAFGLSDKVATGFTVTASAVSADDHKYLVLDLASGGCDYLAAPPEGGWNNNYKSVKMVFARIPAGEYSLGLSAAEVTRWYPGSAKAEEIQKRSRAARQQKFTSDWYMAIFQMTEAQYAAISGEAGTKLTPKVLSYDSIRGVDSETVHWPTTGHVVAPGSFLDSFRARFKNRFLIDLPTEEQWEAAARAGTTTVFPTGGTTDSTDEELWAIVNPIAWYYANGGTAVQVVGTKAVANDWGLYDVFGNRGEWTLDVYLVDAYGRPEKRTSETDPVGPETWRPVPEVSNYRDEIAAAFGCRIFRSSYAVSQGATIPANLVPSVRSWSVPSNGTSYTARFCIHLKPLVR